MKVLKVSGWDDYGALEFENAHGGTPVSEVIADINKFLPEKEGLWVLSVHEMEGDLPPESAKFIRSQFIDYDHSKHTTFYVEGEKV